jgi:hypothetical protein
VLCAIEDLVVRVLDLATRIEGSTGKKILDFIVDVEDESFISIR